MMRVFSKHMYQMLLIAVLLLTAPQIQAQKLPAGWRLAMDIELRDDARNSSANRFTRAEGDFNGDGVRDKALVLKSTRFSGEALWVWLSDTTGGHRWIQLDQSRLQKGNVSVGLTMAVSAQAAGVISYMCFDTAKNCDLPDGKLRPKLKLQETSLVYFKPESAASLYFWSNKHARFLRVWLTD